MSAHLYCGASAALLVAVWGCANPVPPSGGPPDTTPPALVATAPESGSVRVTDPVVEITFSEALEPRSVREAVTVTPAPSVPPQVEADGATVRVVLPELAEQTTYIVTLGTELRDARNVALRTPVQVAFATGERIDAGVVAGQVRDAQTGRPAPAVVLAYPDTVDLGAIGAARPIYRTQTDPEGRFELRYLADRPLVVLAADLEASTRVRAADVVALPPRRALRPTPDSLAAGALGAGPSPETLVWWAGRPGGAAFRGFRALADRLLELRLTGFVTALPPTAGWTLADSAGAPIGFTPFLPADSTDRIALELDRPQTAGVLTLIAGTPADPDTLTTRATTRPDTLTTRLLTRARAPLRPLPGDSVALRFSRPPTDTTLARLTLADTTGARTDVVPTARGARLLLPAVPLDVRWASPAGDTTATADTVRIRPLTASELGDVGGTVAAGDSLAAADGCGPLIVEAIGPVRQTADVGPDGTFVLRGLPDGSYRFRLWRDLDGDRAWSAGSLDPFAAPEPLAWSDATVDTRPRWQVDLPTPLPAPRCPSP